MRRIPALLRILVLVLCPLLLRLPLIPGLWAQDIMHILDLVVAPDGVVHALPPQGLERVVDVWDGDPAAVEDVAQERLVGKVVAGCG